MSVFLNRLRLPDWSAGDESVWLLPDGREIIQRGEAWYILRSTDTEEVEIDSVHRITKSIAEEAIKDPTSIY